MGKNAEKKAAVKKMASQKESVKNIGPKPGTNKRTRMDSAAVHSDSDYEEEDFDFDDSDSDVETEDNEEFIHSDKEEDNLVEMDTKFTRSEAARKQTVAELEKAAVAAKDWMLKGEASATQRPLNSLLEEDLEFESNRKSAPVITETVTATLEDMIKARVRSNTFNNIVRKKTVALPKAEIVLDTEKSKQPLAELYSGAAPEKADDKAHAEIDALFFKISTKLDALSNFFFTPKPLKAAITVVSNVPALLVEEPAPISMSSADRLAPQEIYSARKKKFKPIARKEDDRAQALKSLKGAKGVTIAKK